MDHARSLLDWPQTYVKAHRSLANHEHAMCRRSRSFGLDRKVYRGGSKATLIDRSLLDGDRKPPAAIEWPSGCSGALPLRCGDRHARYAARGRKSPLDLHCTARAETGPETVYAFGTEDDGRVVALEARIEVGGRVEVGGGVDLDARIELGVGVEHGP
jgi:hypothetical protein